MSKETVVLRRWESIKGKSMLTAKLKTLALRNRSDEGLALETSAFKLFYIRNSVVSAKLPTLLNNF